MGFDRNHLVEALRGRIQNEVQENSIKSLILFQI